MTVRIDGDEVDIGHARQRCVLACLALDAGRPVATAQLLDRVWADHQPQRARAALASYLSRLRRILAGVAGVAIRRQPDGYLLAVDPMTVDVHRFHDLTAKARALAGGEQARELYRRALALWRGEAFAGMDTPWLNGIRASLDAQRLAAELDYYELALDQGAHSQLVAILAARAQLHPLDERLAGQLLLALYRCGRQADALDHYQQIRRRLAEQLGADPGPVLQQRYAAILRQDPALDLPARTTPNNLSAPLSSFVGRGTELSELRSALLADRLVTLTGVGGTGKSRLALEAARSALPDNPDGVWLVELAAVLPGRVNHAVAAVLGVAEQPHRRLIDLLVDRLQGARTLLVLDNCEQVIGEVADLAHRLLAECVRLRMLITSRERLGVTGEVLRPVPGLAVPERGVADPAALETVDAVQLFVDRATGVDPTFRLTLGTAGAVAQICRRLDGLPLAIELAAASLNVLAVDEVVSRLDDRFSLLTRGGRTGLARHQTLRAAVDWSYDMLGTEHRRLFNRMAVFVGGGTLAAIEAVCGEDGEDQLPLLAHLVDASLVVAQTGAEPTRYRMLDTLRAYGLERLDECGETVLLRDRHTAYVLSLAESADAAAHHDGQPQWSQRLAAEYGNIGAALAWSHQRGEAAAAIRIAGLLQPLWDIHGHYAERTGWLNRVLAMDGPVPALCEQTGDLATIAGALQHVGVSAIHNGDLERAAAVLQTTLQHARAVGDERLHAWSLLFLATTALSCGEYRQSIGLLSECETRLGAHFDAECLGWVLVTRAAAILAQGEHGTATKVLADGIDVLQNLKHQWGLSVALAVASAIAGAEGDDTRMVILLAASERLRHEVGAAVLFVQPFIDKTLPYARITLGTERFDHAWHTGQTLTMDAALDLALRGVPGDTAYERRPG